jgi:trehalose/maltose transport system substrate-binding protein
MTNDKNGALLGAILMGVLLPSCFNWEQHSPPEPFTTQQFAGQEINYLGDSADPGLLLDKKLCEAYSKKTHLRINYIPRPVDVTDGLYTLKRYYTSPKHPTADVALIDSLWNSIVRDDLRAFDDNGEDFLPVSIQTTQSENKKLMIKPYFVDLGLLYYRKDWLESAGFKTPPNTWAELKKQVAVITRQQKKDNNRLVYGLIYQGNMSESLMCNFTEFYANLYNKNWYQAPAENIQQTLSLMSNLLYSVSPQLIRALREAESSDLFAHKKAVFMRNWASVKFSSLLKEQPNIGIALLPDKQKSCLGGWGLGVSKRSRYPEAAQEFINYLTSPEVQAWRATEGSFLPSRLENYTNPKFKTSLEKTWGDDLPLIRQGLSQAISRPSDRYGFRYYRIRDVLTKNIHSVFQGNDIKTLSQRLAKILANQEN